MCGRGSSPSRMKRSVTRPPRSQRHEPKHDVPSPTPTSTPPARTTLTPSPTPSPTSNSHSNRYSVTSGEIAAAPYAPAEPAAAHHAAAKATMSTLMVDSYSLLALLSRCPEHVAPAFFVALSVLSAPPSRSGSLKTDYLCSFVSIRGWQKKSKLSALYLAGFPAVLL